MTPIRFFISKRRTLLTACISFNGEIISPYSYYIKKGLVYITIIFLFSCQPFFILSVLKPILAYYTMYARYFLISIGFCVVRIIILFKIYSFFILTILGF